MNEFLKTKNQILTSTEWLIQNAFTTHPISCKDWELKQMTERLTDGDLLDMGADGSFVLHNAILKGVTGRKVGIDLIEVIGTNKAEGVEYFVSDLMQTDLPNDSFDTIVCASVIEHEVDFRKFANEVRRLLRVGGKLIVSFDYFDPKPDTTKMKLYSLSWNILDRNDVLNLVYDFAFNDMALTSDIDWTLQDAVINPAYCSPAPVSYTFGILEFIKK